MERIENNKDLLKICATCTKKERNLLFKKGSDDFIRSVLEIVLNLMKGNIKICKKTKHKLKKYKKVFRKLLCPNITLKLKRKELVQNGGFLSILLPTVINGILSYIFNKRKNE